MDFDVAVVGAGPGGSSTAAALAEKGLKVALIDRSDFPRDKVCGGAVSPRALSSLEEMGLLSKVAGAGFRKIRGVRVSSPNGMDVLGDAPIGTPYRNYGYTVLRSEFDEIVRLNAIDKGATFIGGAPVIDLVRRGGTVSGVVLRQNGQTEVTCKAVVGADGPGSVVAKLTDLYSRDPDNLGVASRAVFKNVHDIEDYVEFHFDRSVLPGYAWIFPLGDGHVNIGLGGLVERFKHDGSDVFHLLDVFMRKNKWASERLADAEVVLKPQGWVLPLGGRVARSVTDGVLLVGDSAHHINPLTGEGIEYSMEAGRMAADVLVATIEADDLSEGALEEYETRWRKAFTSDFENSIRIRNMLQSQSLFNLLVRRAKKKKVLADTLAGLIANMLPKEDLNSRFKWFRRIL
jgi:geranylgeranyl reductase family protein